MRKRSGGTTWMAWTSRDEPGHDGEDLNLFSAPKSQRQSPHLTIDRYRVRCRSSRFAFQPLTLFETRFFEL